MGITCVFYLDDISILGDTYDICAVNLRKALNVLKMFGWFMNIQKSDFRPSNIGQYLSFVWSSLETCLELPTAKKDKLIGLIDSLFGIK